MKGIRENRSDCEQENFVSCRPNYCEALREAIAPTKQALWQEFEPELGQHSQVLRLALNEAEALAWETDYPHLLFPMLAVEKAQAAVAWYRRQQSIRPTVGFACAE